MAFEINPQQRQHAKEVLEACRSLTKELLIVIKNEQEAILRRRTADLPPISERVFSLSNRLEEFKVPLDQVFPVAQEDTSIENELDELLQELKLIQQGTLQNRMLIQHNLEFLQQVYDQSFNRNSRTCVYDESGIFTGSQGEGGALLQAKI